MAPRAMAAASPAVAAAVAAAGEVAVADSAAAAAIPTISLGPLQRDPLYPHLGPAIGRDIAGNGLGEFLRTRGAEMPLVDEVGILPGHR